MRGGINKSKGQSASSFRDTRVRSCQRQHPGKPPSKASLQAEEKEHDSPGDLSHSAKTEVMTWSHCRHREDSILLNLRQPRLHPEVDTNILTRCTHCKIHQPTGTAAETLTTCMGRFTHRYRTQRGTGKNKHAHRGR